MRVTFLRVPVFYYVVCGGEGPFPYLSVVVLQRPDPQPFVERGLVYPHMQDVRRPVTFLVTARLTKAVDRRREKEP